MASGRNPHENSPLQSHGHPGIHDLDDLEYPHDDLGHLNSQ